MLPLFSGSEKIDINIALDFKMLTIRYLYGQIKILKYLVQLPYFIRKLYVILVIHKYDRILWQIEELNYRLKTIFFLFTLNHGCFSLSSSVKWVLLSCFIHFIHFIIIVRIN